MQSNDFTKARLQNTRRMRFLAWLVRRYVALLFRDQAASLLYLTLQTSKGDSWLGLLENNGSWTPLLHTIGETARTYTKSPTPGPSISTPAQLRMMIGADKLEKSWNSRSNITAGSGPSALLQRRMGLGSENYPP